MKVYIQTDIEGVAGYCFFENRKNPSAENLAHRHRMYRLLTNEVNAAVKAAFDSGADDVIVNDNHGSGYNIFFEDLDPRCRIIHGRNSSGPAWLNLLDASVDAMVLIGMHAMAGTPAAITSHSLWDVNNGEFFMSEGSMAAALAGDFDVPTVFVSGDDKITAEIAEKIPEIEVAVVKQALAPHMACSVIPAKAHQMIYEGVKKGLAKRKEIPPYKLKGPLTLSLYDSPGHIPPFKQLNKAENCNTITEAFVECQKDMPWTNYGSQQPDGFVFPNVFE